MTRSFFSPPTVNPTHFPALLHTRTLNRKPSVACQRWLCLFVSTNNNYNNNQTTTTLNTCQCRLVESDHPINENPVTKSGESIEVPIYTLTFSCWWGKFGGGSQIEKHQIKFVWCLACHPQTFARLCWYSPYSHSSRFSLLRPLYPHRAGVSMNCHDTCVRQCSISARTKKRVTMLHNKR